MRVHSRVFEQLKNLRNYEISGISQNVIELKKKRKKMSIWSWAIKIFSNYRKKLVEHRKKYYKIRESFMQ